VSCAIRWVYSADYVHAEQHVSTVGLENIASRCCLL
jgi:hypothetical protein